VESNNLPFILCPACHGENPPDAVFCHHPACHKALGEFHFVTEDVAAQSTVLEKLADKITYFTGHPHFVTVHVLWFSFWILINSGLIAVGNVFDVYPYSLLGIILSIEAILITSFILISQSRENRVTEIRDKLEYEVNVQSYRKLKELQETIKTLANRLEDLEEKMKK
jgi:uncharacterized membrane protein